VGIAQAASTISIMRPTSARASTIVLPISMVTDRASSSWRATRRWRRSKSLRARAIVLTARHAGRASRAACTAASGSAAEDIGTCASSLPVAGFLTSSASADEDGIHRPAT